MPNQTITFRVDGKVVPEQEIRDKELERARVALHTLYGLGANISFNGADIDEDTAMAMSLEEAKTALAQSREAIGRQRMIPLLQPLISQSDAMWHEIAASSPYREKLQASYVEAETTGIELQQFLMFNRSLATHDDLYIPSMVHPEHYYFEAGAGGTQTIIETFGMYGEPSYMYLEPPKDGWKPVRPDTDTRFSMVGNTYLASDRSDTKLIGMHQFKEKTDGFKVKLGVFLPAAAPKEMVEGHKWHMLIEFDNGLHMAGKRHLNFMQKTALGLALRKMERQGRQ